MTALSDLSRRLARALAVCGALIFLLFAGLTISDALARSLLSMSLDFVRDTGGLVVAVAGACCLPLVVMEQEHIQLRVFEGIQSERVLRAIGVFANAAVLATLLGIAYQFVQLALKTHHAREATWMLGIPSSPFYFAISALLCLCVLMEVVVLRELFGRSRSGDAPP